MASRDVSMGLGDLVPPVFGVGAAADGIASAEGWEFGWVGLYGSRGARKVVRVRSGTKVACWSWAK